MVPAPMPAIAWSCVRPAAGEWSEREQSSINRVRQAEGMMGLVGAQLHVLERSLGLNTGSGWTCAVVTLVASATSAEAGERRRGASVSASSQASEPRNHLWCSRAVHAGMLTIP
jgi:hypothetical protein